MATKIMMKYKALSVQVKASIWFTVCAFLQKGISVLTTPIFTRLLTTEEYGQYNVFNSWLGIINILVSLNLSFGVFTQGLVKFEHERKLFFSSMLGLTTTLISVWTVIYLLFARFWNELFSMTTTQMLFMLLMIWTSAVFNFWASDQRVDYRYRGLVALTLAVSAAKPVLGIILVRQAEDKVTARIAGLACVEFIGYAWLFFWQLRRERQFYSVKYWKYALRFNLPLIPHYLSHTVLNNADRIMIQRMISDSASGIYSLAYSLSMVMTLFNTALGQTLNPWIYQKIKARHYHKISSVAFLALGIIGGMNLILIAFAPEAVTIFAPKEYYEAIWAIPPVAMSAFLMFGYNLFGQFAFYYEKTKFIMAASVAGAFLNVVLNMLFIPLFGYMAAAYTTLFCYFVFTLFHYFLMNRVCDEFCNHVRPYNAKILGMMTVGFLGCAFLLMFTYWNVLARYSLILSSLICAFCFRQKLRSRLEEWLSITAAMRTSKNSREI